MKAIIMKGLPASGKSTYALTTGFDIVSKDKIRLDYPYLKEKEVIRRQMNEIFKLAQLQRDVVVDNTHMNPKTLKSTEDFCKSLGYEVEIHDMVYDVCKAITPLLLEKYRKICKERNLARESRIPESVIDEMFLSNYSFISPFSKDAVICDIDGTLANINHRLHFITSEKKDYTSFFENTPGDTLYEPVQKVIQSLKQAGYPIVIMSGRPNKYAFQTEQWLKENKVPYDYILMRSSRDKRPDTEIKLELYNKCLKDKVAFAFDDRPRLVRLRKRLGIYTFDCNVEGRDF